MKIFFAFTIMVGVLAGVLLAKDVYDCDSINQAREPRSCRFDSSRENCRETRCNQNFRCFWTKRGLCLRHHRNGGAKIAPVPRWSKSTNSEESQWWHMRLNYYKINNNFYRYLTLHFQFHWSTTASSWTMTPLTKINIVILGPQV